jgi:hypothetical protein
MHELFRSTTRKLAAVAIAGTTVLGGSAAVWAATPSPASTAASTSAAATTPASTHHHHHRRGLHAGPVLGALRGADYATVEVKRSGSWVTLELDRGTVASYSDGTLEVSRPDGKTVAVEVTSSTVFEGRSTSALAGDRVAVVSSSAGDAELIVLHAPRPAKGAPGAS